MMMLRSGYCKIHFDYPVLDTVIETSRPRYENVTLFNTLISERFAGKGMTYLSHYEYRFPESLFHTMLAVESTGADTPVIISVDPANNSQTVPEYLYEKTAHDTQDNGLAIIVSNYTHPIVYSASGHGTVDVKLRRITAEFGQYLDRNDDVAGKDIIHLAPLYFTNSRDARLEVPLDVGLGSLSPLTVNVTAGRITKQYEYDYVDFGSNITI